MRIRWTESAAADLQSIKTYLDRHHPDLSHTTVRMLYQRIRSLKNMPTRGRIGSRIGTRELLFVPLPYIVVYRIQETTIEILRIYHGAQNR